MARKKKHHVILSDDDVKKLNAMIRKDNSSKTVKCRCQIFPNMDDTHGKPSVHEQIAMSNGGHIAMVAGIGRQYIE